MNRVWVLYSELQTRSSHLYVYISDGVLQDCNIRLKLKRRAVFGSSAKQCLLSVNLKPFLMQTEQQTQERRIVNPRRGRFDTEKSSGARTPT